MRGHAVSKNLIDWEELPIALYSGKDYENAENKSLKSNIYDDGFTNYAYYLY